MTSNLLENMQVYLSILAVTKYAMISFGNSSKNGTWFLLKIVKRYIRVGYNLDIMRQYACLVLNQITVYSYGFLFNCTTVGQASDSMTALT